MNGARKQAEQGRGLLGSCGSRRGRAGMSVALAVCVAVAGACSGTDMGSDGQAGTGAQSGSFSSGGSGARAGGGSAGRVMHEDGGVTIGGSTGSGVVGGDAGPGSGASGGNPDFPDAGMSAGGSAAGSSASGGDAPSAGGASAGTTSGSGGSGFSGSAGASAGMNSGNNGGDSGAANGGTATSGGGDNAGGIGGNAAGGDNSAGGSAGNIAGSSGTANAGNGGAGPGGLTLSTTSLAFEDHCGSPPQTFTISNTSGVPVVWTSSITGRGLDVFAVNPNRGTLPPGSSIEVTTTVGPAFIETFDGSLNGPQMPFSLYSQVTISSDLTAQPSQTIQLADELYTFSAPPLPVIDFGSVPIGQSASVAVSAGNPFHHYDTLSSTDPQFSAMMTSTVQGPHNITVVFSPTAAGPRTTTLTRQIVLGQGGSFCPPNSTTATGTGTYPSCLAAPEHTLCGIHTTCIDSTCAVARLQSFSAGATVNVEFTAQILADYLDPTLNPATDFTLTFDWGDGTSSAGNVPTGGLFYGVHTYSSTGTFSATLTLTGPEITGKPGSSLTFPVFVSDPPAPG